VQIWVPDVRAPEFIAEAHRQSAAIAASESETDDQAFVDAISAGLDAGDERRRPRAAEPIPDGVSRISLGPAGLTVAR
jgi:hypothetical protein